MLVAKKKKLECSSTPNSTADSLSEPQSLRGRRGCLEDLLKMPLDILYEVFANLSPLDLLQLARTSKNFRAFFMTRSSTPFWKAVRRNIDGMPDCPPYLSEPAYTNLAFDPHCHGCLRADVDTKVFWDFRVRYCTSCEENCIIHRPFSKSAPISQAVCSDTGTPQYYHEPDEVKAQKILDCLQDAHEKEDYIQSQKAEWSVVDKHSKLCLAWHRNWETAQAVEAEKIKQNRLDGILAKLRELGWGEELEHMAKERYWTVSESPGVRVAKPLTDQSWDSMKSVVVVAMEEYKTNRLYEARVQLLKSRIRVSWDARRQLSQHVRIDEIPPPRDFALLPEVRAIVDAPDDVVVDAASFEALRPSISSIVEHWYSEKKTFFEELITKSITKTMGSEPPPGTAPLDLAIALGLQCNHVGAILGFPRIIYRCCQYTDSELYAERGEDEYETALNIVIYEGPFGHDHIRVNTGILGCIILAFGKDPRRVTIADMDNLSTRLTCVECHREGILEIMTWRTAIRHFRDQHLQFRWFVRPYDWLVVSDDDVASAKDIEANAIELARQTNLKPWVRCWACMYCKEHCHTKKHMQRHLREYHRYREITKADFWYDPYLETQPEAVYLVSEVRKTETFERYEQGSPKQFKQGTAKYYEYTTKVPQKKAKR